MDSIDDMAEVMAAIAKLQSGHPDARETLLALWRAQPYASPARRCTLAHFLADLEEDVGAELAWDRLALEAATGNGHGDQDAVTDDLNTFLPSLHLNIGDASRRAGDPETARFHAVAGLRRTVVLPESEYGATIKSALQRLLARLSGGDRGGTAADES